MLHEQLAPNLIRSSLHDGRIIIYTFGSVARPVIDAWFDDWKIRLETTPPHQSILIICDVSHSSLMLTPYIRTRTIEMTQIRPEIRGRIAAVVGQSISGYVMRGFFHLLNSSRQHREREVFLTLEDAIRWLEEWL